MDLNPLNTPNTVLSDCLNGTLITYNGNEFHLQNDQGNYKLKHCKLKPNYIPVGLKEYGDILYIVSYNPLEKTVEVGSYPSPLMITETSDDNSDNNVVSIIKSKLNAGEQEGNYTELMSETTNVIFNGEDFKLNPGDKYCLQASESDLTKYETIEYYILGDDSNPYKVTDKIILDELNLDNEEEEIPDYVHVPWTIPGWLNIKVRLAEISTAGINVKHFYVPKTESGNRTAYYCFNLRLNINDKFLTEKQEGQEKSLLEAWCDGTEEVGFHVRTIVDGKEFDVSEYMLNKDFEWDDWYENSRILWREISGTISGLTNTSVVEIEATPFIVCEGYKVLYDNATQKLTFDLQSVDDKVWNFGEDLYQFYLNDNEDGIIVYTDIDGPLISSFPIEIKYSIKDLKGTTVLPKTIIPDYKGIGENVIEVSFNNTFIKENIYILTIEFFEKGTNNSFSTINRFLITSKIFSDFTDRRVYDRDIAFKEWVDYIWNTSKDTFEFAYPDKPNKGDTIVDNRIPVSLTSFDNRYFEGKIYNTFFDHENPGLSPEIIHDKGERFEKILVLNHSSEKMNDGLWNSFQFNNSYQYYNYHSNEYTDCAEGSVVNLYDLLRITLKYDKLNMPFEFVKGLSYYCFSEPLSKLTGNSEHNWRLKDRPITVMIEVNGRKVDDSDEQEEAKKTMVGRCSWNGISSANFILSGGGTHVDRNILGYISGTLWDNDIPMLLVKVNYRLDGKSDNWKLAQLLYGQNSGLNGTFEFVFEEDKAKDLYFVAFRPAAQGADPVLIPLSETDGFSYFENLCKSLYIVTEAAYTKVTTDRYLLKVDSVEKLVPRLTVKQIKNLIHTGYRGTNLLDENVKKTIILNFNCKYSEIFISGTKEFILTKEQTILDKSFESTLKQSQFPYRSNTKGNEGLIELEGRLNVLNSKSESEFISWDTSIFNKEFDDRNTLDIVQGFYCEHVSYSDSLIKELTNHYNPSNKMTYLEPASVNEDLIPSRNRIALPKEGTPSLATWIVFHNWWKTIGGDGMPGSKDNYFLIGSCWKEDPSILLTQKWNWITYGL